MKVLYMTQHGRDSSSGVAKKIYSQCKAIQSIGHECRLLCPSGEEVCFIDFSGENKNYFQGESSKETFAQKTARWNRIFSPAATDHIKNFAPDIIYIRGIAPLLPRCISFLKSHKGKSKIFWEFPTYPYRKEFIKPFRLSGLLYFLFDFRSLERLKNVVDEFVVVNEIDDRKARERLGNYRIIPNGFDVASVSVRNAPGLGDEIHILGLANLAYWHGYDRIISGMAEYKGPYKVIFHLAGGEGKAEIEKLKAQATQLGVRENVIFYEPLHGDALSSVFDKCHIAADALGGHRKGLTKSSALKVREYCSRGIPFFTSCTDDSFQNFDYCLNIPADDSPADIRKLCDFAEKVYKIPNHEKIMREYAKKNLDWKIQMAKLFN